MATTPAARIGRLDRPALTGVLVRELINYSSYWKASTFSSTVEPTIYLLAFGFGFRLHEPQLDRPPAGGRARGLGPPPLADRDLRDGAQADRLIRFSSAGDGRDDSGSAHTSKRRDRPRLRDEERAVASERQPGGEDADTGRADPVSLT